MKRLSYIEDARCLKVKITTEVLRKHYRMACGGRNMNGNPIEFFAIGQ